MIDVNNESGMEVDEVALIALSRYALDLLRIHPLADLSVLLVDEETMTEKHERFMDLPGPTDVMSFPDEPRSVGDDTEMVLGRLGDIAICPQVTSRQAAENGRDQQGEIEYLLIHGLLHLLGHDHAEPEEKAVMFNLNDRIIAGWELTRSAAN
ncbi:probable rRNA maturation factor [Tessaracoccus bendigoensis DSM 12906]|uniref:Endoribonuclease YbeY n=1 Tax=Tessaracoccus bendigoensis DSM 12906 TaxID=1123357 RepID=A0A1M6CYC5_9ACTN|nr:rRNA maturation RNase YbeY [Tessaracoccus bendigoensis]SHI66022.1 probable rRNA maturation factor [Tessaracoccus bendigoensis DSM 12906]